MENESGRWYRERIERAIITSSLAQYEISCLGLSPNYLKQLGRQIDSRDRGIVCWKIRSTNSYSSQHEGIQSAHNHIYIPEEIV